MKSLFLLLLSVDALFALPSFNRSNIQSDSLNEIAIDRAERDEALKRRWVMVPDSEGRMYLVDLKDYKAPPRPKFNADKDIKFVLSTRIRRGEVITTNVESIEESSFNGSHPTRITIHGWNGDETSGVNERVIDEYLRKGDFNCIMVDWSRGAGTLDYIAARYRIDDTAKLTADLIDFLYRKGFVRLESLHIVGHSLGAHAAGMTGKFVTARIGRKVGAIYGLDPAGPLFYDDEPERRIAATDATYVEVMHTNGYTLGFGGPLGQADFYPNFGRWQNGCGIEITGSCSHTRAPELFAEAINSDGFVAMRCKSAEEIDKNRCTDQSPNETYIMSSEPAIYGLEGYFYFETNKKSLFAMG